ncbi:hypothetical protein B0O99DRAFT_506647 [Bisporella sp. PMI_857]|nr:hypothetical protein B0O99DRAFT_506647 [Bisporella sp. PMI_857]
MSDSSPGLGTPSSYHGAEKGSHENKIKEPADPEASGRTGTQGDIEEGHRGGSINAAHIGRPIPTNPSAEEIERLRQAMNAQLQLNQQRAKLTQHLEHGKGRETAGSSNTAGKTRVSPISEETISPSISAAFASPPVSAMDTTSTESTKTIRGGITPALNAIRTPSYPFPNMRTPGQFSHSGHRPFTALSPTVNPSNFAGGHFAVNPHDQVLSGSVTPASTLHFQPSGTYESHAGSAYPTPNLYDLTLTLASEPGLDAWWTNVVQLMRDVYKADRVTLSVPADSTDLENVPWGQKATFNSAEEDHLSLAYLPHGSRVVPSSVGTNDTSNSEDAEESPPLSLPTTQNRPGLLTRHSFTTYEDTKRDITPVSGASRHPGSRPAPITRAKSYLSTNANVPPRSETLQNAELSLKSLQDHIAFEDAKESKPSATWEQQATSRESRGRLFSVLQALDYEADPLIDSSGILRVLERGKVIALTRDYPYLENPEDDQSGGSKSSQLSRASKELQGDRGKTTTTQPELVSRISSFLGSKSSRRSNRNVRVQTSDKGKSMPASARGLDEEETPKVSNYEEYEQTPPSPWAQSPAPSPAVRAETGENPFFSNATIDEETFNPNTHHDYTKMQPVEAIGIDKSWTVLHIPLIHPLLSKPVQSFRLDAAAIESRTAWQGKGVESPKNTESRKPQDTGQLSKRHTPIAILSILSPVIPYPSNLRRSLENLSPHLATSFSLCRHYSNLQNEIAGLSRKRPQTSGFGSVAPGSQPASYNINMDDLSYSPIDESAPLRSVGGSITSPSDYSGISRSAGSPAGTPGWDPGSVGLSMDRRSSGGSPAYAGGESYFNSKKRPGITRMDTGSASSILGSRRSKENSPAESKIQARYSDERPKESEPVLYVDDQEDLSQHKVAEEDCHSATPTPRQEGRVRGLNLERTEGRDKSPPRQYEIPTSPRRQALRLFKQQGQSKTDQRAHTQLHSYGADFGATFQSLPVTSAPSTRNPGVSNALRTESLSLPTDMPPPSDRLKGLMLDSLPAHVFVALPQTGEIVWVNNRYLTYRGQTVPELYEDPWGSIHPEERDNYLKAWAHAIKTGEQFSMQVRIRRFDGNYRWFFTRAVGSRDIRGVIVQWYGSHMDIHEQHLAEVKAARQEEIEASEAKHRQLANLIPQIIFAATEDEGVTFANEQWLSYTGQDFDDALGLGFMDYIHPEDLAKCHIPHDRPPTPQPQNPPQPSRNPSQASSGGKSSGQSETPTEVTVKGAHQSLSRHNSSSNSSAHELPTADLSQLAKSGVIKASTDTDGRLSYTTELRLKNKLGEYRWHLVRCVEVDNISLGKGDGSWFGACTDINDHKLLEAKLKEAMESKGKFLSNMSHEIRTPLIGISGMVNFLQDTVLNDEQSDYANTISSSANSLLNIINDILDLSKVDAGMMKLSHEWFHFRSLVEEVNEMVSTLAITKRLELNYVVDVEVPEMVKGDKFRIRQILLNVIGNAIKFTQVGEVFTRCRVVLDEAKRLGQYEAMIEFSVIDTGRGFTKEEAELMFKPFSQIDGSSTRQHGGSGLGLVISRQLAELHGGKMEGSAVPGKGSTFKFTAVFGIESPNDHPEPPPTPSASTTAAALSRISNEISARAMKQAGGNPILANKLMHSPAAYSPRTESSINSPTVLSSGSSNPSTQSLRSNTRSSVSSYTHSLTHFENAAHSSGMDLSQMKLALPERSFPDSLENNPNPSKNPKSEMALTSKSISEPKDTVSTSIKDFSSELKSVRPPMYSILLICPQAHSREATKQHIEITLPKDIPHQITSLSSAVEARETMGGEDPVLFTHIVLNLPSAEEIVMLIEQIIASVSLPRTSIVILSDPVQRQEVIKMATFHDYDQLAQDNRVRFIYKPVKPSRFAVIFDPDKERDLSTDKNRSNAQQQVASQKQNYLDVGKRLGNRGLKVLLVEDNLVNQKVLLKYLAKVGIEVELALDGVECTEKVFSRPHSYYSLILCDLHMPRKDGYQTCREVRQWEEKGFFPRMPIIALSANVMADVLDKCVQAGFNSYVTKPVDFKALSTAMSNLLDPSSPGGSTNLVKNKT